MASIEFNGVKVIFEEGICTCKISRIQQMGQGLLDRHSSYYGNPHNFAVDEFLSLGGKNPVYEEEPPADNITLH